MAENCAGYAVKGLKNQMGREWSVCVCVPVRVCACVWRERERERETQKN
jgi:hypothetical protein